MNTQTKKKQSKITHGPLSLHLSWRNSREVNGVAVIDSSKVRIIQLVFNLMLLL